jgi:hypothetical protein
MGRVRVMPVLLVLAACGGQTLDPGGGVGGTREEPGGMGVAGTMPNDLPVGGSTGTGGTRTSSGGTGSTKVNPGDVISGGSGPTDPGEPLTPWPDQLPCKLGSSENTGNWVGYYDTQPGGQQLYLSLGGTEAEPCGFFSLGAPEPLPPIVDAQDPYPPGYDSSKFIDVVPRFAYALIFDVRRGAEFWFSVSSTEPWRTWCEQQTPYYSEVGWRCDRNLGAKVKGDTCHQIDPSTGEEFVISCQHLELCNGIEPVCACNADGCQADPNVSRHGLELTFSGDIAKGSFDGNPIVLFRE